MVTKVLNPIVILVVVFICITKILSINYSYGHYKKAYYGRSVKEQYDDLACLTENIYYEASNQSLAGKIAVGQITMNRLESGRFGKTICNVVHSANQFSWTADKPKSLVNKNEVVYNDSREVAKKVLFEGERISSLTKSIYYHTKAVNPTWDDNMKLVAVIGEHNFYEEK